MSGSSLSDIRAALRPLQAYSLMPWTDSEMMSSVGCEPIPEQVMVGDRLRGFYVDLTGEWLANLRKLEIFVGLCPNGPFNWRREGHCSRFSSRPATALP
jgi:hypothetical protein